MRRGRPPTVELATFLDYARDTARAKCEGISPEDA
ncbi:mini-circle protein, partial [Streptomyces atratus]